MKSIKILGLNASPRGKDSNTLRLVTAVLEGASKEGATGEIVDLYSLDIKNCNACYACYSTGECILLDDFSDLFEKILESDGIVLGAPNYFDSVPGLLKTLFDRLSGALLSQKFIGKLGCSVSTAGGNDTALVMEYMNKILAEIGANIVGGVSHSTGIHMDTFHESETDSHEMGKRLTKSIRGEITYPDQDLFHEEKKKFFSYMVKAGKR